ncbi:hypothetical protein Q8F55_008666 [Vanrija albida]|uniref:Uncharacterized protein n=1 Tax=Vanrija albida TaxID=181172 RepID=A0ABR3PRG9_9TREE
MGQKSSLPIRPHSFPQFRRRKGAAESTKTGITAPVHPPSAKSGREWDPFQSSFLKLKAEPPPAALSWPIDHHRAEGDDDDSWRAADPFAPMFSGWGSGHITARCVISPSGHLHVRAQWDSVGRGGGQADSQLDGLAELVARLNQCRIFSLAVEIKNPGHAAVSLLLRTLNVPGLAILDMGCTPLPAQSLPALALYLASPRGHGLETLVVPLPGREFVAPFANAIGHNLTLTFVCPHGAVSRSPDEDDRTIHGVRLPVCPCTPGARGLESFDPPLRALVARNTALTARIRAAAAQVLLAAFILIHPADLDAEGVSQRTLSRARSIKRMVHVAKLESQCPDFAWLSPFQVGDVVSLVSTCTDKQRTVFTAWLSEARSSRAWSEGPAVVAQRGTLGVLDNEAEVVVERARETWMACGRMWWDWGVDHALEWWDEREAGREALTPWWRAEERAPDWSKESEGTPEDGYGSDTSHGYAITTDVHPADVGIGGEEAWPADGVHPAVPFSGVEGASFALAAFHARDVRRRRVQSMQSQRSYRSAAAEGMASPRFLEAQCV